MKDVPVYAQALMRALGPQTESIDWVGFDGEQGTWAICFDDQAMVLLEWFAEQESFLLCAGLGLPPADGELAAYKAVLAYNALWRENGGAHIGMLGADGELALMLALPARSLTQAQLQQVVLGLAALAERWRLGIAQAQTDGAVPLVELASASPLNRV